MFNVQKEGEKKELIDVRKVSKAVKSTVEGKQSWDQRKLSVVKMLEKMNNAEVSDWLDQVLESTNCGQAMFKRMAACGVRKLASSTHLYDDYCLVGHNQIMMASNEAIDAIKAPNGLVTVVDKSGDVTTKQVVETTHTELKTAWHHQKGLLSAKEQLKAIKGKILSKPVDDDIAKVLSAKTVGDHVEVSVSGFSKPVVLTKNDVKNFLDMMMA